MGRLLPFKSEQTRTPDEPRVLDLDDEATEEALSALSSDTARQILATLYEEPKTPPEIRDEVGTSLQNVHYHVERLEEAELIQPAGEGYSEKGTEMTIYAPASEALVLFAGREHHRSRLKTALTRLLGSVGLLAVASLAVQRLFGESGATLDDVGVSFGASEGASGGDAGGADGGADGGDAGGADGGGGDAGRGDAGAADPDDANETLDATTTDGEVGIFGNEDTATEAAETATATAEPSATPQGTPTPDGTPAPTAEPTPTAGGTATPPPQGTPSPTPVPEGTPTPAPTAAPAESPTPQATATPTAEPSPTPQATGTPTAKPSPTPDLTVMESGTRTPSPDTPMATESAQRLAESGGDSLLADPAVAFFLGGLFMILVVTAWWYWQG